MVSAVSIGERDVQQWMWSQGREVRGHTFTWAPELDFNGTSASFSQISCRKSLIPKGRSRHMAGDLVWEMTTIICSLEALHVLPGASLQQRVPPATPPVSHPHKAPGFTLPSLQFSLTSKYFPPAQPLTRPEHTSALHPDCHRSAGRSISDSL